MAEGFAQGAPSGKEFSVISRKGQVKSVEVSPSTTYIDPVVPKPRLSDIALGFYITVFGEVRAQPRSSATMCNRSTAGWRSPRPLHILHPRQPRRTGGGAERDLRSPRGIFGNPNADHRSAPRSDFALDQCPSDSQAGLITVHANYEGDPDHLLGTAPIFDVEPGGDQTALFAFIVPTLNIPINIPVAVRTGDDYGLSFTVSEHHPADAAGRRRPDLLGLPGRTRPTTASASQRDRPATRRLPGACRHGLHRRSRLPRASRFIRSPTTRRPAPASR